jgi:hypothetical protein
MDIDLVQAQWTLDKFPHEQLPAFAGEAMVQGFTGPKVLDLASYDRPTLHLLSNQVVEAAFLEMGRPPLTRGAAAFCLARHSALRVLRNQISTVAGAAEILQWVDSSGYQTAPPVLMNFMYGLEDLSEESPAYSQRVIELAWELVNEGSAP